VVPAAAAEQLHANVVSWSPNDVPPGEPVFVVLQLYSAGSSPYPKDGNPVAGVNDVEMVIHSDGQTRRFATDELGAGRYSSEIIFPNAGGWDLRVSYAAGSYGAGGEILLGKGALCVGGEICVDAQPAQSVGGAIWVGEQPARSVPAQGDPRTMPALALGVVLIVALVAAALIRLGAFGRRRRRARPA
jgi:hypothetical protein